MIYVDRGPVYAGLAFVTTSGRDVLLFGVKSVSQTRSLIPERIASMRATLTLSAPALIQFADLRTDETCVGSELRGPQASGILVFDAPRFDREAPSGPMNRWLTATMQA